MSDDLVRRRAALVRRLRMDVEPSEGDMEDAADLIESQSAEIARLRADLATARREGMEDAAKIAETRHELWHMPHPDDALPFEVCDDISACNDIAAAIRTAAKEEQ